MTYVIYKLKSNSTGRVYIGYETTESDLTSITDDLVAEMQMASNKCCDPQEDFQHEYLRRNVPENELWKTLRGFMDSYNSVEEGYNTEEEYEKVSAQIVKAATQNQVDSSENWTGIISFQDGSNITSNPNLSTPVESVISLTKSNLISLAAEHGFSSDTIVLYLYLNTIPGNQFTDLTLEQAAKDLDLTDDTIKTSYDVLVEDGLIEEARAMYHKRHLNSLQTVGYREMFDHFDGKITLEEAIDLIKRNSRHYAKRQMTWFRRDTEFSWFSPNDIEAIIAHIDAKILQN